MQAASCCEYSVLGTPFAALPAVCHGSTAIDQQRRIADSSLFDFANVKAIALAKHLPVDVAKLVTANVRTMLLELNAEAFVRRAVTAGTDPSTT